MQRIIVIVSVVVLAFLGVWYAGLNPAPKANDEAVSKRREAVAERKAAQRDRARVKSQASKGEKTKPTSVVKSKKHRSDIDEYTPEEQKLADAIDKALEDENLSDARSCAQRALECKNSDIRQAAVDLLAWFDDKAIPELTPFMADPNPDVADSAMSAWSTGVSFIENDGTKIQVVEKAMKFIENKDFVEDIASEYIGVDEKLAVESLLNIIEGGGSKAGIDQAKETYEFVTGEEFNGRAAAEKWIAEEYEPSDN